MEAEENEGTKLINLAIQKLLEEKRADGAKSSASGVGIAGDEDDQLLLSKLLAQLESLKEDNNSKLLESPTGAKETICSPISNVESEDETEDGIKEMGTEEIVKELKEVKRQNTITHWLLSIMIFVTVAWQLSEVSLVLEVKNKLSNPLKSVGRMITRAITGGRSNAHKGADNEEAREIESQGED